MLPLVDKPTIQYVVEEAVASGLAEIIIVTGRGKRAIEDHFDAAFELEYYLNDRGKVEELAQIKTISELASVSYVRQKEPLGLGHAILCARALVGEEPFGVFLGDDIIGSAPTPCMRQLLDVFERHDGPVIAVERVPRERIHQYGVIAGHNLGGNVWQIDDLVEKPRAEDAPSDLAIIGRYVLTPDLFEILAKTTAGKRGEGGDVGFERAVQRRGARGDRKRVKAEVYLKALPEDWDWGVLAGIEEAAALLEGVPVDVRAMDEGTIFAPYQPIMVLEGVYVDWARYETALLGVLCQASGIATKAARCKKAAGERQVISFGARRMHPALAPMIERNAFIGGCDGVAVTKAAELIDADPTGTIPHALVLMIGDTVEALKAFHQVIEPKVRRVALIDTLQDEKFEAIRVAEALGDDLYAVRLDTPSSRRGDLYRIVEEVRWELNLRGFGHVKIITSGGIDEYEILRLNPVVDAYGVGTSIANAPVVSFALDIMEIEGRPMAKRGKWSGAKEVFRRRGTLETVVQPAGTTPPGAGPWDALLKPLTKGGRIVRDLPPPRTIRDYVLEQLEPVSLDTLRRSAQRRDF